MGQQQLLLILLGIIIVGIAIAISTQLFRQNAIDSKRDILINECFNLAHMAIDYYKKPIGMGGGSKSFNGWSIPDRLKTTVNGSFEADINSGSVLITAIGNEVVTGNDSIKVQLTVLPNSISTQVIN